MQQIAVERVERGHILCTFNNLSFQTILSVKLQQKTPSLDEFSKTEQVTSEKTTHDDFN